jgi:hypothetical protein
MPFGFYMIMAAQFFSALADNALLIASIYVLREMQAPQEYEPLSNSSSRFPTCCWPPLSAPLPTRCPSGG